MRTSLTVLLLVLPLITQAMCEREETLYTNSVSLYVKTKELNESSKQLFEKVIDQATQLSNHRKSIT